MQTGVSGDYDCSLDVLLLGSKGDIIGDCAVELPFLEDVPFVDYLYNALITPIILADFSMRMLLFTFN